MECKESKNCYQPASLVITVNLRIITDSRIRSTICKDLNTGFLHRKTSTNIVKKFLVLCMNFIIDGFKREHFESGALNT